MGSDGMVVIFFSCFAVAALTFVICCVISYHDTENRYRSILNKTVCIVPTLCFVMYFVIGFFYIDMNTCEVSYCDDFRKDGSIYCSYHASKKPSSYISKPSYSYKPSTDSNASSYGTSSNTSSYGTSSYSTKKKSTLSSYDEGYSAVYDDDDYDWNRYKSDPDYALGVDDAMDDVYDDFGDDW